MSHQNLRAQKIAHHKDLLRFAVRQARKRRGVRDSQAEAFTKYIGELLLARGSGLTLAAYLPLPTEPPLTQALSSAVGAGHRVLVPVVEPRRQLSWVAWTPQASFNTNTLGIAEPTGQRLGPEAFLEADLKLVPALGFDLAGHRLGQGGGYYDRLLPAHTLADEALMEHSQATFFGIVFEEEIFDAIPADSWDARLGHLVTPAGIRSLNLRVE